MQKKAPVDARQQAKTINAFCTKYSICRATAYKEMNSGTLPYLQIGTVRRITREHEAEWLARKEATR